MWILTLGLAMAAAHPPSIQATLTIARSGKSDYAIVLPARPSPSEERAAGEAQRFLMEISGAQLPIVREDAPEMAKVRKAIALGSTRLLRDSGASVDMQALGDGG